MENNEPIRIAQIIGKWVGGGVEAVVMNYYRNINRKRIQFDFICDEDSTNIPYDEIEKLGGKVILIPPYQKVFSYHRELKRVLKEGNYKIVHSHINALSVFSLWAAKSAKVPVRIAHSHSTTNKKEWKKNLLKQVLRPFSKLFATDYFCCSELAGRWLFGNHAYNKGRVYLLNNAIDLDKFKYNEKIRTNKRKELNIADDQLVIGHIGLFVPQKNQNFKNKVNDLGLTRAVKFLGQRSDANELYQAFDVFLLPSLYEGLGMVLIEAQASGLPCVASTKVPKTANIINGVDFLDLTEAPQTWAQITLKLAEKNKRKDCSKEITKKGYNIKEEVNNLEDEYLNMFEWALSKRKSAY